MPSFDHIVLTAANEQQARGYRHQIDCRLQQGALTQATSYHVVPDPGGHRVGSFGATLGALQHVLASVATAASNKSLESALADQRILICHSGGDSRRLPAYAAQGKVFTPLPTSIDGHPAALFDLIIAGAEQLPAPSHGQVLVLTGDVLLTFDPRAVSFEARGVVGVAYAGSIETGSRHGVYVADNVDQTPGRSAESVAVRDFLQKPDQATAHDRGAVDSAGRVLVDTGIVSMDSKTAAKLLEHAGVKLSRGKVVASRGLLAELSTGDAGGIDLYEQFMMALVPAVDAKRYERTIVDDAADGAQQDRLRALYRAVHGTAFSVNVLPSCEFFHIGSSREFLANIGMLNRTAEAYDFATLHDAQVAPRAGVDSAFVYNSIVTHPRTRAERATLIEGCDIASPVELAGRNILVGLPGDAKTPIKLDEGQGLVVLPVGSGRGAKWAAVLFGMDDDFKSSRAKGGTLLNQPFDDVLDRLGLDADDVWAERSANKQTLWNARLWSAGPLDDALKLAMLLRSGRKLSDKDRRWFRGLKRMGMKELVGRVSHDRLIEHRADVRRRVDLARTGQSMRGDDQLPAADVVAHVRSTDDAKTVITSVSEAMAADDRPLFGARGLKLIEMVARTHGMSAAALKQAGLPPVGDLDRSALERVAQAVAKAVEPAARPQGFGILPDQVVWATTPVRLDFAGGWSDTPPICTERGGAVVNAAITLNDQYPVQAMAKLNDEHVLRISSIDLGRTIVIRKTEDLLKYTDPSDWAALPKAAIVLAGVGPDRPDRALDRWLGALGGGLDLTIFSALPKGSGLGTSSVLGAAVLACLDTVLGRDVDQDNLIARVSVLEQLMTTGGGWQDQVGGVFPGAKLIQTQPGIDQTANLRWSPMDFSTDSEFRRRLLLYYTGQKRLAKNILQNVVGRYLARDPEAIDAIEQLKVAALEMKEHLDRRDVDAFAQGIERYWTLKKQLDRGATNPGIEQIIQSVRKWCGGVLLPGAGGGGFVFMVAHDADAAARIRKQLTAHPPNELARFFDLGIDATGLSVRSL